MTPEGERPKLVVRKLNNYHKRGVAIHAEPVHEGATEVDVHKLLEEINSMPLHHVRRGRRKHDRKRKPQRG